MYQVPAKKYGGVIGWANGGGNYVVKNCYNVGAINGTTYVGEIVGRDEGLSESIYDLFFSKNGVQIGSTIGNATVGTLGTITGTGANASITVNGQTKTVIQALNEWVTANKGTYPELKYWSWDNVNNRPMFVDSI